MRVCKPKPTYQAPDSSRPKAWVDIIFTAWRSRRRSSSGCSMNRNSKTTYGWSGLRYGTMSWRVSHLSEVSPRCLLDQNSKDGILFLGLLSHILSEKKWWVFLSLWCPCVVQWRCWVVRLDSGEVLHHASFCLHVPFVFTDGKVHQLNSRINCHEMLHKHC